jgi:ribosome biogenesis GTPase
LLLDKFITVAIYKQITPVLVLTKLDLQQGETLQNLYEKIGISVFPVCYDQPETLAAVRQMLQGKVSALTGNSGAGKSTLLNALYPDLQLPVGEISEKLGRGRHTTRQASLYSIEDGYIADTPGFSTFETEQYARIPKEALAECFPEFAAYRLQCRFQDCAHVCEKGCAVLEAMQAGDITESRHASYVTMYEEAKKRKEWKK